jgi:DnaJ homolog subfamily C member 11
MRAASLYKPPDLSIMLGRKLTKRLTGYISYSPGLVSLESMDDEQGSTGSCLLGLVHRVDKAQWGCDIQAGLMESYISASYLRPIYGTIKGRLELAVSTMSGVRMSVSAEKKLHANTKAGFGVDYGNMGVTLNIK